MGVVWFIWLLHVIVFLVRVTFFRRNSRKKWIENIAAFSCMATVTPYNQKTSITESTYTSYMMVCTLCILYLVFSTVFDFVEWFRLVFNFTLNVSWFFSCFLLYLYNVNVFKSTLERIFLVSLFDLTFHFSFIVSFSHKVKYFLILNFIRVQRPNLEKTWFFSTSLIVFEKPLPIGVYGI